MGSLSSDLDPHWEHEGYVGLAAGSIDHETELSLELSQRYRAGTYDGSLDAVQSACSCGWRGPVVQAPHGVHWEPSMVEAEDETRDALLESWVAHVRRGHVLDNVRDAKRAEVAAGLLLADAVHAARDQEMSWALIASELGVSRQAAWERFRRAADQTPDS